MTKKIGRVKKLSKAVARERKALEAENTDIPRTLIFCKPNSSPIVKQLVQDFKSVMKPYTIKEVFCGRNNTLKEYIDYATKIHVRNIIYFTHARSSKKTCDWNESTKYELGGVYCHIIVLPHGPSFTYRVQDFILKRDIQTESGFGMNDNWLQKPPILSAQFDNSENHLKAVSSSFINMLPTININTIKTSSIKRVLMISHNKKMPFVEDTLQQKLGEVFVFRHYFMKLENKEINKNIRKLGVGVASKNVKIPDMSQFGSVADFINRGDEEMPSGLSSDSEDDWTNIEMSGNVKELPGTSGEAGFKMIDVGPSMTLQLLKIQEGVHSGTVLYHRYVSRTKEELFEIEKRRAEKLKLKEKRREQQLNNVKNKEKLKEEHKKACLKGMEAKGVLKKSEDKDDDEEDKEEGEEVDEENEEVEDIEDNEAQSDGEEEENVDESEDDEGGSDDGNDSDGIEEVNDSFDESQDLDIDGGENESDEDEEIDSDGIEEVDDSLDENSDSDGIEAMDDDDEDDIDLSDEEDDDGSEREVEQKPVVVKEIVKTDNKNKPPSSQNSNANRKRPHFPNNEKNKKRKLRK